MELFKHFINLIDNLIEFISNSKQNFFYQLYSFFKSNNVCVIKFYEFIIRILNTFSCQNFNLEIKTVLIEKSLELLHFLVSSNF